MNLQPAIDYLRDLSPVRETRVGVALDDVADALSKCQTESTESIHPFQVVMIDGHWTILAPGGREVARKDGTQKSKSKLEFWALQLGIARQNALREGERTNQIVAAAEAWAADWGSTIPGYPSAKALWEACQ